MSFGLTLAPGRYIPSSKILFKYRTGDNITALGGTFSRASTATYTDSAGLIQTAASGTLRDTHYISGARYTLLEGQRTRLAMSEIAGWSTQATSSISTNIKTLPSGAVGEVAYVQLGDASDNADHGIYTPVDLPSTGSYTLSVWVRGGLGESVYLYNFQNHQRTLIQFEGIGVWQRVELTATNNAGQIYPCFDTHDRLNGIENLTSVSFDALWPTLEEGPFASSTIIPSTGSSVTRAADSLSFTAPTYSGAWIQTETYIDLSTGELKEVVTNGTGAEPITLTNFRAFSSVIRVAA